MSVCSPILVIFQHYLSFIKSNGYSVDYDSISVFPLCKQSQVNVHGKILCKEKCNQNILILLVRLAGGVEHETKTTSLEQDNVNFMFTKVFPGKYHLEVKSCNLITNIEFLLFCLNSCLFCEIPFLLGETFFIQGSCKR